MDLDRQSIEQRDFPIGRRGYDPAAVDAHLRALATRSRSCGAPLEHRRGAESLARPREPRCRRSSRRPRSTARRSRETPPRTQRRAHARGGRRDAERRARDASQRAQAHVAAVAQATAALNDRVESMDGEASTLVDSLRAGATRLANDLTAVETNMGELYDAASGRDIGHGHGVGGLHRANGDENRGAGASAGRAPTAGRRGFSSLPSSSPPPPAGPTRTGVPTGAAGDRERRSGRCAADRANMALNGDSRDETDRYLAENYDVTRPATLLDEVYAAIEGTIGAAPIATRTSVRRNTIAGEHGLVAPDRRQRRPRAQPERRLADLCRGTRWW